MIRVLAILFLSLSLPARAGEATIAVATNFAAPAERLAADFSAQTGHELVIVTGATGKLAAQIINGAPFDVFLAADKARPDLLIGRGFAMAETRITYAEGRLVLWGRGSDTGEARLRQGDFRRLAIANPDLAPYGRAALQTLAALALDQQLRPKLVKGENIGQTYALVATGNAALGFVALAQLKQSPQARYWLVPRALHAPIRQQAVLLSRAEHNDAARAFLSFLLSTDAKAVIESYGYATPGTVG